MPERHYIIQVTTPKGVKLPPIKLDRDIFVICPDPVEVCAKIASEIHHLVKTSLP